MTTDAPPRPPRADPDQTQPVAIDPRLRARRIAVRRGLGRRRLWAAGAAGAAVVVVVAAWLVVFVSPLLSVVTVTVEGTGHTDPAAVIAAAAGVRGDPLLTADLDGLQERVAALPWVAAVEVRRDWPRSIRVEVVERTPAAALYQVDGTWRLVDLDGRVLAATAGQPVGFVPVVAGGASSPPGATLTGWRAQAVAVAGRLAPSLTARLADVHLDPEGGVAVSLTGGGVVWFGNAGDLATKQLDALAVLGALGDAPVGVLDVRVPGAPVHRAPPAQNPANPLTTSEG